MNIDEQRNLEAMAVIVDALETSTHLDSFDYDEVRNAVHHIASELKTPVAMATSPRDSDSDDAYEDESSY